MKLIVVLIILFTISQSCPDNCNDCDFDDTICSACAENYQRGILGPCVQTKNIPYCSLYGANNICFSCQVTYTLTNGVCIKDESACLEYDPSDDLKCITCGFGTIISNGKCVGAINCNSNTSSICIACLNGFSLRNGKCVDNTGNCKVVNSNGVCTTCNSGYNLVGYACISSNVTVYGCYIWDFYGFCQLCKMGYNLFQGNCLLPTQIYQIQQGLAQLSTILSQRSGTVSVITTTTTTITTTTAGPSTSTDFNGQNFDSSSSFSNFDSENQANIENCAISTITGNCLSCNPGYYLKQNQCSQTSVFCNTYDSSTGACKTCRYEIILNNSECRDPNCLNQQITGCKLCKQLYSINNYGLCTINDPNCIQTSANKCVRCSKGYQLSTSGTCSLIPTVNIANCLSQKGSKCNLCLTGYRVSGNACIPIVLPSNCQVQNTDSLGSCQKCNSGFANNNGLCVQIQSPSTPFCKSYNLQTGKCIACIDQYILQGTLCVLNDRSGGAITIVDDGPKLNRDPNCAKYNGTICSQCSNRYYFGPNGLCIPINPLCNNYSSTGACLSCFPGYIINGVNCIVFIKQLDTNCKSYNLLGICNSCYSTFYFSQIKQTCLPLSPLCKTHNITNGLCLSCFPGFVINPAGMCGLLNSDPYCIKFDSTLKNCVQCAAKYFLNSNSNKCQQINANCNTANETNGACLSCFKGYILSRDNCVLGGDVNCKNVANGICSDCYSGYFLNALGVCVRNNQLCKTIDKNGMCLSCYPGYKLINKSCIESNSSTSSNDANCKQADKSGICTSCYSGYFLNQNMACQQADTQCKTYNSSSCPCSSCYDGYTLQFCKCLLSTTTNDDPYCIKRQGLVCKECSGGYYLANNGVCTMLNPLCKESNMTNGACTLCYQGYSLSQSNCIITVQIQIAFCEENIGSVCRKCIDRYYTSNGNCVPVSMLCNDYNFRTGQCINCISEDYFFQKGQCIFPSQGKDPFCTYYVNSFCTECSKGYAVINYRCEPIDPYCISYDQNTNICLSCSQGKVPNGPVCVDL